MGVFFAFYRHLSKLRILLQIPSTSSRVETSLNGDESELVSRLRDQVSRLNKDISNLHAMAALVKRKSEIATAVEHHALDRLRVATESLSCKPSTTLVFS
jgi:hypothetical protein